MKKNLITLAIVAAVAAPMTVSAAEAKFFGYSQITASIGDGVNDDYSASDNDEADGLAFGADRIRLGYKIKQGNAWGKLQADFLQTSSNVVPNIIKDAVVGYKFHDAEIGRASWRERV